MADSTQRSLQFSDGGLLGRHPRHHLRAHRARATLAAGVVSAALFSFGLAAGPASGLPTPTSLYNQSFTGPTATGVFLPAAPDAPSTVNQACLTASAVAAQTPLPGCNLATPDPTGSGALRLTGVADSLEGGVFYDTSFPTQQGLDISFNSYQWGGSGADGIGFILAAANPANPTPPAAIGAPGGALGYAATSAGESGSGLSEGYLGVGLDVYGNYSNSQDNGTGCPTNPSWIGNNTVVPGQVTVRGPGNGTTGYCPIASSAATDGGSRISLEGTTRANSIVPVEVAINPSSVAVSMQKNTSDSVPAGDYAVAFTDLTNTPHLLLGPLPSTGNGQIQPGTIPSSWINATTGIPDQLTFGWVASTGAATDNHEITQVAADTISGAPVLFGLTNTDSGGGHLVSGSTATWSLGASTLSTGASETQNVSLVDSFPAGVALSSATGTGWICSISGQNVACIHSASAATPIAPGTALPVVHVTGTITTGPGPFASTATVSSADGNPAQAIDNDVIVATPTLTGQASALSLSASLLGVPLFSNALVQPTAAVSTTSSSTTTPACALNPIIVDVLVSGDVCSNVTTVASPASSTASASVANVALGLLTLPVIDIQGVASTSTTTCSSSSGSTTIAFLQIGSTVVISKPTVIAPNTLRTVGPITVILNQQIPFSTPDSGLTVNAINLTVNVIGLTQLNLVVASSQSDIANCPRHLA